MASRIRWSGSRRTTFDGHFHFFQAPSSLLFVPLERHPRLRANPNLRDDRTVDWVRIHGRLDPGVDITQANALVSATVAGLAQRYRASNEFKAATVEPYTSMGAAGRPESRRVISVLLSLAGTVLLIVCLNISGMMLVRGANRERELSIRAALGADRRRLIQHLFFEAVLLAFASGAISAFVLFGIPAIGGWYLGVPVPPEIDLDAVGVAISSGLCLVVSVLFGLLPAVRFSRPNLIHAMKEDAGGGGRQTIRVHRVAAMVQIGIAVPFLVMSGVMLDRVRTAEFGFPTDGLAAARLPMPDRTGARGRLRHPEGSRQSPTGQRRSLCCAGRGHADRLRLPDISSRQHEGREVCHGARHARRRKFSRDRRRAAASRSNDHGRGPHHGGAGRGDFRTARRATVSGHGADWRTRDTRRRCEEETASRSSRLWA